MYTILRQRRERPDRRASKALACLAAKPPARPAWQKY